MIALRVVDILRFIHGMKGVFLFVQYTMNSMLNDCVCSVSLSYFVVIHCVGSW